MSIIPKWIKFTSGGLDPITSAFVNGMTTKPSADFQKVIDAFVKYKETINGVELKVKDIITTMADVIYLGNINDSNDSFRNLVKNAHHGTKEGSGLVWDAFWGYYNPLGTGWVDTNYNPATEGENYTLNDAAVCIGISNKGTPQLGKYLFGAASTSSIRIENNIAGTFRGYINNSGSNFSATAIPFQIGLFQLRRTASNATAYVNQNTVNSTGSIASGVVPNANINLLRWNAGSEWDGGLNFFYAGAALSDDYFTLLNHAINKYYKDCLYLKYGASNWGVQMAKSYFDTLHNFEHYEAWEIYEFIKRMQPDYVDSAGTGYYYNTFGPSGQNKTVCDFLMLFKAGGNLVANAWIKTGATLRWNQSGTITSNSTMPAYTRGTNLGIVTVSSTDGWNGVTSLVMTQTNASVNSFYGNMPNFLGVLKTAGSKCNFIGRRNRIKFDFSNSDLVNLCNGLHLDGITYAGKVKLNLALLIGGSYNNIFYVAGGIFNSKSNIYGSASFFTNEFTGSLLILIQDNNIVDNLSNLILNDNTTQLQCYSSGLTGGISNWNKNCGIIAFLDCLFPTAAVDAQLAVGDNYYVGAVVPIKVQTVNLSGATMGKPTGGSNNVNLLSWVAKGAAVGFTPVITVRTT